MKNPHLPFPSEIPEHVGPCEGGCWYCGWRDADLDLICREFDTYMHLSCLKKAIAENPGDRETEIIAREFKEILAQEEMDAVQEAQRIKYETGPFYAVYCPKGYWRKFETREAAFQFIQTRWCPSCVFSHQREPWYFPGCDAEWDVWSEAEVLEYGHGKPMEPELEIEMSAPKKRRGFQIEFGYFGGVSVGRHAGFISIWGRHRSLHLFVRKSHWFWGYGRDWETQIGAGPLFLYISE